MKRKKMTRGKKKKEKGRKEGMLHMGHALRACPVLFFRFKNMCGNVFRLSCHIPYQIRGKIFWHYISTDFFQSIRCVLKS